MDLLEKFRAGNRGGDVRLVRRRDTSDGNAQLRNRADRPAAGSPSMIVRDVPIQGQMIRLGQLLKLAGVFESGAEVKAFLASEPVLVNGEAEARRGRQLYPGDVIRVRQRELRLIPADPSQTGADSRLSGR